MIEIIVLAIAAFVSTNIDDAFVLVAFCVDPRLKHAHVFMGQLAGIGVLVAIALAFSLLALALPDRYVGYLGVLPILIGIKMLWSARGEVKDEACPDTLRSARGSIASVAAVTIANGGDNVAVYVPLFARHSMSQILLICVIFAAMTGVWCLCAKLLVSHPLIGQGIRRWGRPAVPFVLMALGIYIFWGAGLIPWLGGGT